MLRCIWNTKNRLCILAPKCRCMDGKRKRRKKGGLRRKCDLSYVQKVCKGRELTVHRLDPIIGNRYIPRWRLFSERQESCSQLYSRVVMSLMPLSTCTPTLSILSSRFQICLHVSTMCIFYSPTNFKAFLNLVKRLGFNSYWELLLIRSSLSLSFSSGVFLFLLFLAYFVIELFSLKLPRSVCVLKVSSTFSLSIKSKSQETMLRILRAYNWKHCYQSVI